jgi:thiol:disulfide interchange protein DsbA
MRNYLAAVLLLLAAACSVEEPPPAANDETESAPAAPAIEQAADPDGEGQPAESDAETAAQLAEAAIEAETAGLPDESSAETQIELEEPPVETPAESERFKQGIHYQLLTAAQPTSSEPGRVEVLEVFWYGCPHCYTLEPHIKAWLADGIPPEADFRRLPAALNPSWQILARAYYTAEALGILDRAHSDIFREFHVNKNPLNTPDSLAEFFERYGVSEAEFADAFNSFAVQTKLRRSDALVRRYRITGVPTFVVNGKYVTSASEAGSVPALFEVVNFLVGKEVNRR